MDYANDHDGLGGDDLSQYQSPLQDLRTLIFMQPIQYNGSPTEHYTQRIPQSLLPNINDQQQLPPMLLGHTTWPSTSTNPEIYSKAAPVAIPRLASTPLIKGNGTQLPVIQVTPSKRKTLTDSERRRMCQYYDENPSVKQTEIGAMFGVERSTVSKVLRQREKYLFPEDGSLPPVKRAKGKFPDIERALSNWVRNMQRQGRPLTDADIKEKARFFATTVGSNSVETNSTSWLEKFKQKNGISGAKLTRRASKTNMSNRESLHPDLLGVSASQTLMMASLTSPSGSLSPSPTLSRTPPTGLQPPEPSASNPALDDALDDAQKALHTVINFYVAHCRLSDQNFQHHYEVLLELTEQLQQPKKFIQ